MSGLPLGKEVVLGLLPTCELPASLQTQNQWEIPNCPVCREAVELTSDDFHHISKEAELFVTRLGWRVLVK